MMMDINFSQPYNLVGDVRTNYIWEQKEYASPMAGTNDVFQQIKSEPIESIPHILHRIWIYDCDNGEGSSDGDRDSILATESKRIVRSSLPGPWAESPPAPTTTRQYQRMPFLMAIQDVELKSENKLCTSLISASKNFISGSQFGILF